MVSRLVAAKGLLGVLVCAKVESVGWAGTQDHRVDTSPQRPGALGGCDLVGCVEDATVDGLWGGLQNLHAGLGGRSEELVAQRDTHKNKEGWLGKWEMGVINRNIGKRSLWFNWLLSDKKTESREVVARCSG